MLCLALLTSVGIYVMALSVVRIATAITAGAVERLVRVDTSVYRWEPLDELLGCRTFNVGSKGWLHTHLHLRLLHSSRDDYLGLLERDVHAGEPEMIC
jgi:hypothetical protein